MLLGFFHRAAKHLVHHRLVSLAMAAIPRQNVGIDAQADQLFDGTVEATDEDLVRGLRKFRRVGEIDLGIGERSEGAEFATLLSCSSRCKGVLHWESLFGLR